MTSIQPELWVDRAATATTFYQKAFGAIVVHRVGEGEDIVAQLAIDGAMFWVSAAGSSTTPADPKEAPRATSRMMLIVEDPDAFFGRAIKAGGIVLSPVGEEHGWQVGRILDPFGHEWEIAKPLGDWPPLQTN